MVPNDFVLAHRAKSFTARTPRPLRPSLVRCSALSLIEGVAAAFSRGEQHKSVTQNQLGLQSVHEGKCHLQLQARGCTRIHGALATLAAIAECLICLEEVAVDPTRPIGITIMNIVADNGAPKAYNPASKKMQSSFNNIRDHPREEICG